MDRHNTAVTQISATAKKFHEQKISPRIYHGSTNSTRQTAFDRAKTIDASGLCHVLKIDTATKTALVEPNVPMDSLVEATLPHDLLPPVVMEFPGITAGGGFVGTAGESSSFKHGFFDRTINWFEMVLADGKVVTASKESHPDLFAGAVGSFGTLGILTLLEIQLIDTKPFVEVTYNHVDSVPAAIETVSSAIKDSSNDYVDGILFSRTNGVIVTGRLADKPPEKKAQRFTRAQDPWFYLHAQDVVQKVSKGAPATIEYVPIRDYLFRYDRGAFWMGRCAYQLFHAPFDWLSRYLLNPLMYTRVMYRALNASGLSKRFIIQDLLLPISSAMSFIDYVDQDLGIYPLWLCPFRHDGMASMGHPRIDTTTTTSTTTTTTTITQNDISSEPEPLLNIGVWGAGPRDPNAFVQANRDLENKVRELGGLKWLYAHTYYAEDEFWSIYDAEGYSALRDKYCANTLPSVYDKVKVDLSYLTPAPTRFGRTRQRFWRMRPVAGFYGVYKAILGSDHLFMKRKHD